jgi:hypothetical protein
MQEYWTHDNGGRPFLVRVQKPRQEKKNYVATFKLRNPREDVDEDEPIAANRLDPICLYTPQKTFIGEDLDGGFVGNSLLLQLTDFHYVFIGESIFEFKSKDVIHTYKSPVGNSDVPYPYAYGDKFVYLMIEDRMIPLDETYREAVEFGDPYATYYSKEHSSDGEALSDVKVIHKRIW